MLISVFNLNAKRCHCKSCKRCRQKPDWTLLLKVSADGAGPPKCHNARPQRNSTLQGLAHEVAAAQAQARALSGQAIQHQQSLDPAVAAQLVLGLDGLLLWKQATGFYSTADLSVVMMQQSQQSLLKDSGPVPLGACMAVWGMQHTQQDLQAAWDLSFALVERARRQFQRQLQQQLWLLLIPDLQGNCLKLGSRFWCGLAAASDLLPA